MQLRSIRHDNYDQFAEIFSFKNLQYPTLLLRISIPKISFGPMTHSGRNMDGERCAVLTQSAIVWTPPFWLVVTALGRNCYPSMTTLLNFAKALFFQLSHRLPREEIGRKKMGGIVGLNGPQGLGVQTPCPPSHYQLNLTDIYPRIVWWTLQ